MTKYMHYKIDHHVGNRVRMRRVAMRISQSSLGKDVGVSFSQIQKYENGANRIGAAALYLIAARFGVPISYFYEGLDGAPTEPVEPMFVGIELARRIAALPEERRHAIERLVAAVSAGEEVLTPRQAEITGILQG